MMIPYPHYHSWVPRLPHPSGGLPHHPNTSLPSRYSQGGSPTHTHEGEDHHALHEEIEEDESPLPRKISNESNDSTQDTMTHEETNSSSVNTNNYDKKGRCIVHPHIRLRKKKFMSRLCLGSSSDNNSGWKILMSACPDCCVDELRRIRLVEENNKRVAAKQQQVQASAVENKNESSLNTLDRSDRSGRMTPEMTTKMLLDGSERSASSRPTLTKLDGSQRSYGSSGSNSSNGRGGGGGSSSRGRRYQQQYDDSSPGFTPLPKMKRSSSLSERMGNPPPPPPPRRSPSQDSFRQRHQSNNTPPKRSPSQDSYRSGSPSIKKGQLDRKLNRRMSDETASLTGSSGSSNPGIDTSERTGTSGTTQGTLASTSSASKHVIQLSPVRRSSYGSSQQEKIESIMNSSPSSPRESSSSKSSSSSSREKKRSKSVCNTTCCLELRTFEYRIVF